MIKQDGASTWCNKRTKQKHKEQKEMRDDLAFFVLNCSIYHLQKMTERMKQLKNENSNTKR